MMINGIVNIYKEKGYTSHDVVARLRGMTRQKKIGHTGTLDPDAEGVLPVCFGKATKLCDMLTDKSKTYETVLLLGTVTDTQDISGEILEKRDTGHLTREKVLDCIQGYIGEYEQLPPMYSALKVNGRKLYELAREGIEVERKRRKVFLYDIQVKEVDLPRVRMTVHCSKGTYIRTLCHDIGADLGTGGCMESLLRTRVSRFELKDSLKLDEVEELLQKGELDRFLTPVDAMFAEKQAVCIKPEYEALACNGNAFRRTCIGAPGSFEDGEQVRVYNIRGQFIGIFRYAASEKGFRAEKMFLIEMN